MKRFVLLSTAAGGRFRVGERTACRRETLVKQISIEQHTNRFHVHLHVLSANANPSTTESVTEVLWNLDLNSISMINLVMAVGLVVDYSTLGQWP